MTAQGLLSGRRVIVTQAEGAAGSLAERLRTLGAEPLVFPVIRIEPPEDWSPVDQALERLRDCGWLVFTSQNGVDGLLGRMAVRGLSPGDLLAPGMPRIAAVGEQTAAHLRRRGLTAGLVPDEYSGRGVLAAMLPHLRPGERVLLARGDLASALLPDGLRGAGAVVDEVTVYCNRPERSGAGALRHLLLAGRVDAVTFTSSSTVNNFLDLLGEDALDLLGPVAVACIGRQTEAAARERGLPVDVVPETATVAALAEALARHLGPA